MSNSAEVKEYTAEPTMVLFHNDYTSFVKYVEGPFGSGKTTACIMELMMRGFRQQPDKEGKRRTRWAIVRQTYPELKSTTIKSFEYWVPPEVAPVVYSIPIVCKFVQELDDGTVAEIEFVFMALDGPEDVKKLLSLELTGAYLNEAREITWEIMEGLVGRIPRYPETIKEPLLDENDNPIYDHNIKPVMETVFGPTEPGILLDSNPPRTTHWLYEKFETGKVPKGWTKYKQPAAVFRNVETDEWEVNPDAENLSHLEDDYYQRQIQSASEEFIRVNLAGEYGMSRKGKPVFNRYNENKHVSKTPLVPERGYPLIIGWDFGLTPASLIGQVTNRGVRIFDEMPASDEMLEDYIVEYVNPIITLRYTGYSIIACGDPAGKQRSRLNKRTDFDILRQHNIKAFPAHTNEIKDRLLAVNWFLSRDGGFLIDPKLTHLREAMAGGYVYKEIRNTKGEYSDTPDKNNYSHIADALQYLCLFARFGSRYVNAKPATGEKKPFFFA